MSYSLVAPPPSWTSHTKNAATSASSSRVTAPTQMWFARVSIGLPLCLPPRRLVHGFPVALRACESDLCGPPARAVEVFLNPRMIALEQLGNRPHRVDLLVRQHRHPVADRVQRVEVVGDQEHRQPERL